MDQLLYSRSHFPLYYQLREGMDLVGELVQMYVKNLIAIIEHLISNLVFLFLASSGILCSYMRLNVQLPFRSIMMELKQHAR